jgi:hypothetical protein
MIKTCITCGVSGETGVLFSPSAHRNGKTWYKNECKKCTSSRIKKQWDAKPLEERQAIKRSRVLKQYGLTQSDFDKMLFMQDYACAICKNSFEFQQEVKIDHCHSTGKTRGLLCHHCNFGLGNFKDSLDFLDAAKDYLVRYQNK